MTQQHTIIRLRVVGAVIIVAAIVSFALATEATALTIDPDGRGIVAEESDKPSEAPPAPPIIDDDVAERIAPVPPEEPFFPVPVTTTPQRAPNIDAASFGVGWPAAAAVGVAVVAVLIMALMWRRDEPAWVRSPDRR